MSHTVDLLTIAGARELAEKVRSFWLDRGHPEVLPRVVDGEPSSMKLGTIAVVRSNLVNGLPPRKRGA